MRTMHPWQRQRRRHRPRRQPLPWQYHLPPGTGERQRLVLSLRPEAGPVPPWILPSALALLINCALRRRMPPCGPQHKTLSRAWSSGKMWCPGVPRPSRWSAHNPLVTKLCELVHITLLQYSSRTHAIATTCQTPEHLHNNNNIHHVSTQPGLSLIAPQ